jgi:hypothetical protein
MTEMLTGLGRACADPCCDLDLRSLVFGADMPAKLGLALVEHALRGLANERARARIDEEILFLDTKRE